LLIAGNHDAALNNKTRMDSLSPIVNNLNHKNLFYLRDSGIYTVADIDIGVFSVFGNPNKWPSSDKLDTKTKIAFVHAPVLGSVTDIGYEIENETVKPELFNGYDIVMCGDIHKKQTIQEYRAKKGQPIIQMPGSLIQQNYGESTVGNGWCEWNVDDRSFIYNEI
jgi:DNA repair exonuclease SbcCD nuclease subunit